MRVSAEKTFRKVFPNATIEGCTTNARRKYYLVRAAKGDFMPYADGETRAQAWRRACEKAGL